MEPIVDDTRQLGILNEADLVYIFSLVAPHEQVLVQISQIRLEDALNELFIDSGIVVLYLQVIFGATDALDGAGRRRSAQVIIQTDLSQALNVTAGGCGRSSL